MNLRDRVAKLAHDQPELRKHLVPLLRKEATGLVCDTVSGADRMKYAEAVWDMYVKTYRSIGLIVSSAHGLLSEFPLWELCLDQDGIPHAFGLSKTTPFGLKSGLSGHDGTPEGKSMALLALRTKFKRPGHYGEVSHKVLEIALAAGAPVVCATYVPKILGKDVEPQENGVSYKRNISGVGPIVKVMIGHPRGIPTTDWSNQQCPVDGGVQASVFGEEDEFGDLAAHHACMVAD